MFQQGAHVRGVIDGEVGGIAGGFVFDAEDACEDAVKSSAPESSGEVLATHFGDSLVHFSCRFVGEGEDEDV